MAASSGLAEPPDDRGDLAGFPAAGHVDQLHRCSDHPGAWWFSSVEAPNDEVGGRFDRTTPRGTCYLAEERLDGALVEKLLRTPVKVVVHERLVELFHATVTVRAAPPTADLTAQAATGFGLNAEVHDTLDYGITRRWAAALDEAGWRALRHRLRGDVTGELAGRCVFGGAGLHQRAPAGMRTRVEPLDVQQATAVLEARGVEVRPIPRTVPIADPPATGG
ncbi:MAG: RES domain-containing protein [Trueperaceae bacterium]|nr:RES domain-containing protein [Trueperaceae bacterium]